MIKKVLYFISLVLALGFLGCVGPKIVKPEIVERSEILYKLTERSYVEYSVYNYNQRVYHLRYSLEKSDSAISEMAIKISGIEGISDIGFGRYSITLKISPAYEWSEIQPKIVTILEDFEADISKNPKPEPETI